MKHIHHYDVPAARSGEIIERLSVVLRDDRFAGSKDWRESGLVGRAEWLIASYEDAKEYYALLGDNAERDEELMQRAHLLCLWIRETLHSRGSVNGLAAQLERVLRERLK